MLRHDDYIDKEEYVRSHTSEKTEDDWETDRNLPDITGLCQQAGIPYGKNIRDTLIVIDVRRGRRFNAKSAEKEDNRLSIDVPIEIKQKFIEYSTRLKKETAGTPLNQIITRNKNYRKVFTLTEQVIPLLLQDMIVRGYPWHEVLEVLVNNPPEGIDEINGTTNKVEKWIEWGLNKYKL